MAKTVNITRKYAKTDRRLRFRRGWLTACRLFKFFLFFTFSDLVIFMAIPFKGAKPEE
jgi:hypothetical protein